MKKSLKILIAIALSFLIWQNMSAQRYEYNDKIIITQEHQEDTIEVHKQLKPYFKEMLTRMRVNGVDLSRLSEFEGMYIYGNMYQYLGYDAWGICKLNKGDGKDYIYISDGMPTYLPTFISAIVYHEFYHCTQDDNFWSTILKYFQNCGCPYVMQSGDKINVEVVVKTWDEEAKQKFIEYLKCKQ